jgi:hypothetical protein
VLLDGKRWEHKPLPALFQDRLRTPPAATRRPPIHLLQHLRNPRSQIITGVVLAVEFPKYNNVLPSNVAIGVLIVICVFVAGFAWSWGPLGWLVSAVRCCFLVPTACIVAAAQFNRSQPPRELPGLSPYHTAHTANLTARLPPPAYLSFTLPGAL